MSRTRVLTRPAPRVFEASSPTQLFLTAGIGTIAYPSGNALYSGIVDDVIIPRNYKRFQSVTHDKTTAAVLDGNYTLMYNPPVPPARIRNVNAQIGLSSVTTGSLPAIPWADLITQLSSQLDGSISQGSLVLVTLGELAKTIKMVKNPFNLLKTDWRKVAGKRSAATLVKSGANIWLEKKYGWDAAANDVESFGKTYAKISAISTDLEQQDSRYHSTAVDDSTVTSPQYIWGNGATWSQAEGNPLGVTNTMRGLLRVSGVRTKRVVRLGCRQNLATAERLTRFQRIQDAVGLSTRAVAATIWELVPYSFVVDWFINWNAITAIGQRSRLNALDIHSLGFSTKTTTEFDVEMLSLLFSHLKQEANPWYGQWPTALTGTPIFKGTGHINAYRRMPVGAPDIETIISGFFQAGLSTTRGISGLALLIQRILK